MALMRGEVLLVLLMAVSLVASPSKAQLRVGFYSKSCPKAELIVKQEVQKAVRTDSGIAPALLRLHFHDCFVRGCDGSVLIDSTKGNKAEKDAVPNSSLHGFEVIDGIKKRLEAACNRTVSCADILAFAARDSIVLAGGMSYQVQAGRRDGRTSRSADTVDLPPPFVELQKLLPFFTKKGLNLDDLVTLSGAHTIGDAHCSSFTNRLYNYSANYSVDPTLDPSYAAQLQKTCTKKSSVDEDVFMDPRSPAKFDVSYYKSLMANRGLFSSDQTLMSTAATAAKVKQLASNSNLFMKKFGESMVKMGRVGVLTGKNGEIRCNCRKTN